MRLVFALDQRYHRTPDRAVWVHTGFAYRYWTRFLDTFEHVQVVARALDVNEVPPDMLRVDGEGVSVVPVPYYVGPWQYLLRSREVRIAARNAVELGEAVILYGGSPISNTIEGKLTAIGYPYAVHVGGDPYDVFAPGSIRHPLRPFLRWWSPRRLRDQCAGACAAAYVTEKALQRRYPCPGYSVALTDVELPTEAWVAQPRTFAGAMDPFTAITVGTLEQMYKAQDVLIRATAKCVHKGLDLRLVIVGDGKHRDELERLGYDLGIRQRVNFRGQIPAGERVRAELDRADLFVLASHQEGLPRAMIEAMARALPCIGSTVGGIPELLLPEDMVRPGDADALAAKILQVATDPQRLAAMSARNLNKARVYSEEALQVRRLEFHRYVKEKTEEWLRTAKHDGC